LDNYDLPSDYHAMVDERAELLSTLMGKHLAGLHGPVLDFSYLLRPFYYLYLFVYANASFVKPTAGDDERGLQPLLNLHKLSDMLVNNWGHQIIYAFSQVEDPVKYATGLFENLPCYEQHGCADSVHENIAAEELAQHVGISLSIITLEKLMLWLMSGGSLRFVKPAKQRREKPIAINPVSRDGLLVNLANDPEARQLDEAEYRLLLCSVLFLPTYYLEDFACELKEAKQISRGLSGLICGIEFQHKPAIAIALALLKQRGAILVGSQHGGAYGQTHFTWLERAERYIFDHYITWGYQYFANEHPLPSIRLSRPRIGNAWHKLISKLFVSERKTILVVLQHILPSLSGSSHHPNVLQQHEDLRRSLELLEPAVNGNYKIILRMHPWNVAQDYETAIPDFMRGQASLVHGKRGSLGRDMHHFGFVLFTTPNATGLAECIVNGVPFTIISNPESYRIRPEAEPVYAILRKANVWVTEPEQLTAVLNSGKTNEQQHAALDLFGKMYAFHTYGYLRHWSRFINKLNRGLI
jgi:hypothetical protein